MLMRRRLDREARAEMEYHVEMETRSALERGVGAGEARRMARVRFGSTERYREEAREARGVSALEDALSDVRYGLRGLARNPGFATVAILTLALGVGANTAIYSVVNGVLVRALPFEEPDRLVSVWGGSRAEYVGIRDRATQFEAIGAYALGGQFNVSGGGDPVRLTGAEVSGDLFRVLRVSAAIGRTIERGEELAGSAPVVVLSHGLWRDRYGSDPAVLGRTIEVDGAGRTVVGVMGAAFAFPSPDAQLWIPVRIDASNSGFYWGSYGLRVVARLRDGTAREAALQEVRAIAAGLRQENPVWTPDEAAYLAGVRVQPLQEQMVSSSRTLLLVLLGATGLVLLMACANVANLLLVRGAAREQEIALRSALGAGRRRLLRQLVTESLLLSVVGGAAGVLLAIAGLRGLVALLPPDTPRLSEVGMDGGVLAIAAVVAISSGVLFGLAPALRLAGSEAGGRLAASMRTIGALSRRRMASVLVAVEVALAIVLVIGATLLVRSLWALQRVDPGFRTAQVVTARVSLPHARYALDAQVAFWEALVEQLRAAPGVMRAGVSMGVPFDQTHHGVAMWIDGHTTDPNALDLMQQWKVTPGYIETLDIPLLRGRNFDAGDRAGAMPVAWIDERSAGLFWKDRDPIGGRIRYPWGGPWITIVGVVGSVRNNDLSADIEPSFYVPLAQSGGPASPLSSGMVVLQTSDAGRAIDAVRGEVARLAPDAPVSDVRTIEQRLAASVSRPRSAMTLLGVFAALAVLLGTVGTWGVMAWVTTRRTRELALRLALGAEPGSVTRLVARQGLSLALAGGTAGVALAFLVTGWLRSLLFGVSPRDPLTFLTVPLLFGAVAVLASWIPARRAARLSPMSILRGD